METEWPKIRYRFFPEGKQIFEEKFLEENSAHCPEILRMEKHAIMVLCSHFKSKGWLWYSH